MLRYLFVNLISITVLILFLIEIIQGIPSIFALKWISVGIIFSFPVAIGFSKLIRRKLILGQGSFLDRRPIGGVWFFILSGTAIGLAVFTVMKIGGEKYEEFIHIFAIVFISLLTVMSICLGVYVFMLERKLKKKIYIRVPDGLFLSE